VFNSQEKITVHFHTRVYIHTGQLDKHNDNIVSGVLGEGAAKPPWSPSPPARGLGERCKLRHWGPGQSPGDQQIFTHFIVPRTALLRNMRPPSMREAPRPGG